METFNYPLNSDTITNDYEATRPVPTALPGLKLWLDAGQGLHFWTASARGI